ncbi:hypothetical protein [Desertivirga xinjiangensis]|nr:hypothetical protein [Pedobacter xinjiangensis]
MKTIKALFYILFVVITKNNSTYRYSHFKWDGIRMSNLMKLEFGKLY